MLVHENDGGISTFGTAEVDSITYSPGGEEGTPWVATLAVAEIGEISADGGGHDSEEGASAVLQKGLCWSTSPEPTIADAITMDGTGTGTFTSDIEGSLPGSTYYLRAYYDHAPPGPYAEWW